MLIHVPDTRAILVTLAAGVLFGSGAASASPVGVTLGFPDIQASVMQLTYDPLASELFLSGYVQLVTHEDLSAVIVSGDFEMAVAIDELGVFSGGSFTMFDDATLLLSGELTAIVNSNESLEFMYDVTGGTVGASYDVGGLVMGFREGGGFGFIAHAAPIASNPVPEPSAALLFLIGGAAIATRITRRN